MSFNWPSAEPIYLAIDTQDDLACTAPSLQPYYGAFITTAGRSAPVPRIGTLPLAVFITWGSPVRDQWADFTYLPLIVGIETTGSPLPCQRLPTSSRHLYTGHHRGHEQAAPRLKTHPKACRCPEDPYRSAVLMPSEQFSMRQQWFTHVRLLDAHLTQSCRAFSRNAHHDGS